MHARTQSTDSFTLATLLNVKQEIGEALFDQASTDLASVIYEAANNKNKAHITYLLDYKVTIISPLLANGEKVQINLFNVATNAQGYEPLYLVARRALNEKQPDIIDFLLTHFPNFNKRPFVLAFAENNDVQRVNAFLDEYNNDQPLLHAAILGYHLSENNQEIERLTQTHHITLPDDMHIIGCPFWPYVIEFAKDINPIFLNKTILFFHKEKNVTEDMLVTQLGYGKETSPDDDVIIHLFLAYYNHYQVLQKIVTPSYLILLEAKRKISQLKYYMIAATMGGSYEAICILLMLDGKLDNAIANTLDTQNYLLASKIITLGFQASTLKKTPPIANQRAATFELQTKKDLHGLLLDFIILLDNAQKAIENKTAPILNLLNSVATVMPSRLLQLNNPTTASKKETQLLIEILMRPNRPDTTQRLIRLKDVLEAFLPLFDSSTHSLSDLLNKPLNNLLPPNNLKLQCHSNLFQYIANHPSESFAYLRLMLACIPNIMHFVSHDTLTQSTTLTSLDSTTFTVPLLSIFALNPASSLDILMTYPTLLPAFHAHDIFSEIFPYTNKPYDELKIETARSIALLFLTKKEATATFFLKMYSKQMEVHLSNPFLLYALLQTKAGKQWLKKHIHALKSADPICYDFADIGKLLLENEEFASVIMQDNQLIESVPSKYRAPFTQKKEALRKDNKKIFSQSSAPKEKTKDMLVEKIENQGYQLDIDFSIAQENNHYEIVFSSKGDVLSNIRRAFQKTKQVKLDIPAPQSGIYKVSLSFNEQNANPVIEKFKSDNTLKMHRAYQGAIQHQASSQKKTPSKPDMVIDVKHWTEAIKRIFCESSSIQVNVTEVKQKPIFTITCSQLGKEWELKKDVLREPKKIIVMSHHIKKFFLASLIENLENKKLATVDCKNVAGNQQKIIIKPLVSEPIDVANIQANNFDAFANLMPRVYGCVAIQRVDPHPIDKEFFTRFMEVCEAKKLAAKLMKKDGTVASYATDNPRQSKDIDYVTTCKSAAVFQALGLTYNEKSRNMAAGVTLYSGLFKSAHGDKWIDVSITPDDKTDWALQMAVSADITYCSVGIVMYKNEFYFLDPLERGLSDFKNKKIIPVLHADLDEVIKNDPIRIIRVIKQLITYRSENFEVDSLYHEAILNWQGASFNVGQFSKKLLSEMKNHITRKVDINDPVVALWFEHLRAYKIMEKAYQQEASISDEAALAVIRGRLPAQSRLYVKAAGTQLASSPTETPRMTS